MWKLLNSGVKIWVISTKCFCWNVSSIKLKHIFIVELKPIVFLGGIFLSFFNKTVVVSTVSRALVNNYSLQRVLEVVCALSLIIYDSLIFI